MDRSGFGGRYSFNRRNPGILFRGNTTRNGYKPGITSSVSTHSNVPSRSQNQVTPNRHSSASTSQSSSKTESSETSSAHNPTRTVSASVLNRQETSDGLYSATSAQTQSKSQVGTTSNAHTSPTSPSSSQHLTHTNPLGNSQSTSNGESSSKSDNTENSQQTLSREDGENDDSIQKKADNSEAKVESASSSKAQPAEGKKTSSEKPSRTRISSSLLEKYPWLATRYPDRFGAGARTSSSSSSRTDSRTPVTRTSSSIGAGRPVLRGTPTRVSGATGAAGVSTIQETKETNEEAKSLPRLDSLKNNVGMESIKPSVISQREALSNTRQTATSTISSSGHRDSSEVVHRKTIIDNESQEKNYFEENNGRNEATDGQKGTVITSADSHKNTEDNDSVETREDSTNTRTGSSSGVTSTLRRPVMGVNGRGRSPLSANRPFGSRFSVRPQPAQNSKLDSASESASSHLAKPVLTLDNGTSTGSTVTRTGGLLGGTSQSESSSSSSTRDGLRGQGGRFRNPIFRGKPTNGGGYKPANGNGIYLFAKENYCSLGYVILLH